MYGNMPQGYFGNQFSYTSNNIPNISYARESYVLPVNETVIDYKLADNSEPNYGSPVTYGTKANGPPNINLEFVPSTFVKSHPKTVCNNEEIIEFVKETLQIMGLDMPATTIEILERDKLKEVKEKLGGTWSEGIQGFCLNNKGFGQSHIFIRENDLASVMLTIGHEIGHVISFPLDNIIDEEAKAFAFSMAWMDKIKEFNIAGLRDYFILDNPAENGVHNVAFNSVIRLVDEGITPLQIFEDLIYGRTKHINNLEALIQYG